MEVLTTIQTYIILDHKMIEILENPLQDILGTTIRPDMETLRLLQDPMIIQDLTQTINLQQMILIIVLATTTDILLTPLMIIIINKAEEEA